MPFLTLLGLYLAGLVALAWTQRRRAATAAGFYLGDRRFGALATGSSLAATTIGASAILTAGELVYVRGAGGAWIDLAGALGLVALGAWLVPRVREGGCASLAEIAGRLFGAHVRAVAAVLIVLAEVGWLALQLRGAEAILLASGAAQGGWALALSALAVVAVTCLGGQHAVTWSDVVQLGVMTAGLLLIALPAAVRAAGDALWAPGPAWNFPWGEGWPAWRALEMLIMVGLPHMVGSDVYAKVLAARDERSARRGVLLAGAAKALFGAAVVVLALAARQGLPGLEPPAAAVPAYLREILPAGLHMLVLLSLMAIVLSSADTVLLTATTVLLHDLLPAVGLRRYGAQADPPPAGAAGATGAPRAGGDCAARPWMPLSARTIAVLVLASCAILVATRLGTMVSIFRWAYSLFAAGLSLPILLGLVLRDRLPARAARAGMVCGAACAAVAGLWGLPLPVAGGLAGCLIATAIFWLVERAR